MPFALLVPLLLAAALPPAAPASPRPEEALPGTRSGVELFTVNTLVPATPVITSPTADATLPTQRPTFTGTAEPNVTIIVSVDGKVIGRIFADSMGNWFHTSPEPLVDGPHTSSATAMDTAGNTSTVASVPFSIATNPPDTLITAQPPPRTTSSSAIFQFNSPSETSSAIYGFECSLDGRNFVACTSPMAYTDLADDRHTFAVRARAWSGAVDPTPATYTWWVGDDSDNDGLPDDIESATGTSATDDDSDDDGLLDGNEDKNHNGLVDAGETDPREADTDGDGLQDGTELGLGAPQGSGTGSSIKPDADPTTTTNPLEKDTDGGGAYDGNEDKNHNGRLDPGETDPNKKADDTPVIDSDGDGLPDGDESSRGTDPLDDDTDDDGLTDGKEVARYRTDPLEKDTDGDGLQDGTEVAHGLDPNDSDTEDDGVMDGMDGLGDTDKDGTLDALDADSDDDGLEDGTELGVTQATAPAGTNTRSPHFVPDEDPSTTTPPKKADTDEDGLDDGDEDANHNGRFDPGETDPGDEDTDDGGTNDGDEVRRLGNPLDETDDRVDDPGCNTSGGAPWVWLAALLLAMPRRPRGARSYKAGGRRGWSGTSKPSPT